LENTNIENNEVEEAISDVEQKKFSDFSKKVKTSLEDKLRNNPTIKDKGSELQKLQSMKDTFAKISEPKTPAAPAEAAPEVTETPTTPETPTED